MRTIRMSVKGDAAKRKMKVVFCWHMHQPDYRDLVTGEYYFPWTYLHAIKDYVDMVAHLERYPKAHAVFNFAPILLEQLEDYAHQVDLCLTQGKPIKDTLLNALVAEELPAAGTPGFAELTHKSLRSNRERIIDRLPASADLADAVAIFDDKPRNLRSVIEQILIVLLL